MYCQTIKTHQFKLNMLKTCLFDVKTNYCDILCSCYVNSSKSSKVMQKLQHCMLQILNFTVVILQITQSKFAAQKCKFAFACCKFQKNILTLQHFKICSKNLQHVKCCMLQNKVIFTQVLL